MDQATLITYPISTAGAGDQTVLAATPGKRWVAFHVFVEAGGATDLTFKSGSTAITGAITAPTAPPLAIEFKNHLVPVLVGRDVNEALVVNSSNAVALEGFVVLGLVDSTVQVY